MFRFIAFSTVIFLTLSCAYVAAPEIIFPTEPPGSLTFIGNAGSDNVFTVQRWKFERLDSLDQPENIAVTAVLDMTSITTGWKDLEQNLHKKKDYFHSKKFSSATLTIDGATPQPNGGYLAQAELSLKGVTKVVPLAFTLTGEGPYELNATATVMRSQFRFTGDGPAEEVPVTVTATLK